MVGEVEKGFSHFRGLARGIISAQGQRLARHLFRILKFTQGGVNIANGIFKVRLYQRLICEVVGDSRYGIVEELAK
jgi:hypothetical protein